MFTRTFICGLVIFGVATVSIGEETKLSTISVPESYQVEVAASSALVAHPLMADFDEQGRLYVAASAGENLPREELEKQLPNFVRRLEDTNGDGVFDKATTFADNMTFPQGCMWLEGSLYVASSGAIWKLTDTDDDGVADERVKLVGDFGYTGNAADVHGPFKGPEGRIYWCEGRHGHEIVDSEGQLVSKGKAARIFSCLPDGSDVQTFSTGGMDNPVEIVFTPSGDMLGTVNLMYSRPRGDCLVHWQYGGVYPREDFVESLDGEFVRTGPLLSEIYNFGHVAVSGLCRWTSKSSETLLVTEFNTNRVVQVDLKSAGSSYETQQVEDFFVSTDKDFHPTDVLEAPDGSLLVIDTGGWFRIGCPQSGVAKSHIEGAIYRVKRTKSSPSRKLSQTDSKVDVVWKLRNNPTQETLKQFITLLESGEPPIRKAVARSLQDWPAEVDRKKAILSLLQLAKEGTPAERRNALATLAHWKVNSDLFVRTLIEMLPEVESDPQLRHAAILGLIRSDRRDLLRQAVLDRRIEVSHAASLSLEQLTRPAALADDSDWLEIPAPSMGQPLTESQKQTLLDVEAKLGDGDAIRGRDVFFSTQATCSKCHRVTGEGGLVGPDLTTIGRSRSRRDLLESILYPSATFARGFAPYLVMTEEGKTHTGIILGESPKQLHIGIDHEKSAKVASRSIEAIRASDTSIMPAELNKAISEEQLADLLAYLQSLSTVSQSR